MQSPLINIKVLMRFSKFHLVSSCTNNSFFPYDTTHFVFVFLKASHWAVIRLCNLKSY